MSAQAWCLLLFAAVIVSGVLSAVLAPRYSGYQKAKQESREAEREAAFQRHLDYAQALHGGVTGQLDQSVAYMEVKTGARVYPYGKDAPVKAEPLYDDDEDSDPFNISLQVYGDLEEGKSASSAISFALTHWLRNGAQAGGYTASNGLRVHLVQRGVRPGNSGECTADD